MRSALLVACWLIAQSASAIDDGVSGGRLEIGSARIALRDAYAYRYADEEGVTGAPELRVLLTDAEVPEALIAGHMLSGELEAWARAGRVRGLVITIDPRAPTGRWRGTLLVRADPDASLPAFDSDRDAMTRGLRLDATRATGRLEFERAATDAGPGVVCDIDFSAPVFTDPPLTADLRGAEAAASAPARVALELRAAARRGALDRVATLALPHRLQSIVTAVGEDAAPEDITVTRTVIRGNYAVVVMRVGEVTRLESLEQRAGRWLVR